MSIADEIQKNIDEWLNGPYDEATKNEIRNLKKNDPKLLADSFVHHLAFGTAGIRELMGVGINRLNIYTIRSITQGLSNYIKTLNIKNPSVLIGYDNRHHSKEFAMETAKVLAANGIKAYQFKEPRPTPLISFGARYKKCISAIMITASHNTKEYNGYKVYWSDGGQVIAPHDERIVEEVNKINKFEDVKVSNGKDPLIEIIDKELDIAYFEKLITLPNLESQNKKEGKNLKIIYSNLHGTGITLMLDALSKWGFTNISVVEEQKALDGNFPNAKKPNPEEKEALKYGVEYLKKENADIFIATDPDSDRIGIVEKKNNEIIYFTGNQLAVILLYHLLKTKKISSKSASIKSIVTTELFRKISDSFKISCFDVLTGFKYIAEKMRIFEETKSDEFLIGAEESFGYLIEDFVRDKDAISAACIFAEITLDQKLKKKSLLDLLYDIYNKFGLYREKVVSIAFEGSEEGQMKMKKIMQKLREEPLSKIANYEVIKVEDYKTRESIDLKSKKREKLILPTSNVLRYWLDDGTKIVIRPSGTEPKIKIYVEVFESNITTLEKTIKKLDERLEALIDVIKMEVFN